MQKISSDVEQSNSKNLNPNATDTIANVLNFSRKNLSNITIIKKDGTKEK